MEPNKSGAAKIVLIVLAILIAVGAVVYVLVYPKPQPDGTSVINQAARDSRASNSQQDNRVTGITIVFSNDGFAESAYAVKKGQAVTVKNDSTMSLQFSSDDHSALRDNTELNMSTLAAGQSGVFTPTKIGTWGFHDHINSQYVGELVVVE